MRCVMLMFDSLNRHFLSPYGCPWTHTPNFARLARHSATFDRSYVCSMPCMPARRDLHTGRPGFLHRGWGPLEPWDRSVFDELRHQCGVHSHLATDHYHYFEDGGANYHCRYDTWETFRGQEGDPWIGQVGEVAVPEHLNGKGRRQDWVNRPHMIRDADHCQTRTIDAGLRHIERNAGEDNWLLQIECFDPHEPFFVGREWQDLFPSPDAAADPLYDWPEYGDAPDDPKLVDQARRRYAALLAKCDASLGHVLDSFDRHDLWDDTMLIVWTDHGILLGEHGLMMKNVMPLYEEIGHTPLFIHDPRHPAADGTRRGALVQPALDLAPTLCGLFGATPPDTVLGHDLAGTIADDVRVRDAAIFGYHGGHTNLVTERHLYHRGGNATTPVNTYTLNPQGMRGQPPLPPLRELTLAAPLADSQDVPPLKLPGGPTADAYRQTLLYDLAADPTQQTPLTDAKLEADLAARMRTLMTDADAPPEQFERVDL
jgi:arylsulfatase A-like enzyme